jgi:hypothetical protein
MFQYNCIHKYFTINRLFYFNNQKYFHTSLYQKANNNNNNKQDTKAKTPTKPKPKISFFEIKSKDSFIKQKNENFKESIENSQNENENVKDILYDLIKQQQSIASKIANLINKIEPDKTVEKLLEPVVELKKLKEKEMISKDESFSSVKKSELESIKVSKRPE